VPAPSTTRSLVVLAAFLCGSLGGCEEGVVTQAGADCAVEIGERREHILERCGKPCRDFGRAKGACRPQSFWEVPDLCANSCDQYGNIALCYADGVLVHVFDDDDINLVPCTW